MRLEACKPVYSTPLNAVEEALCVPTWCYEHLRDLEMELIDLLADEYPDVLEALEEAHPELGDLLDAITTLLHSLIALS